MELELTQHAIDAMNERLIALERVEDAVSEPELRTPDPVDPELERFYRRIPPRDDRVLRVVVNTRFAPWRIVSVFFDRRMRRML
ncbi:MAG: DUF4258 domain-containing protein [Chloroflexota bacterium]|nr:DUF4258 domain-containing protein [Chloroflexota bacterium]